MMTLVAGGCVSKKNNDSSKTADSSKVAFQQSAGQIDSVGGICWNVPQGWRPGPEYPMRVFTCLINPAEGNTDSAECGVFSFEGGQGGTVGANIDRWINQMSQPDGRKSADLAKIGKTQINGLQVTTVDVAGTYSGMANSMGQMKENKTGYYLKGAIIEGPQGLIFFKLIGPTKTVLAAGNSFGAMLKSSRMAAN